jgi:hypothetical protein
MFFIKKRPFFSNLINRIALTVFSSYLITDNLYLKAVIWNLPFFHNMSISVISMNLIGLIVALLLLIICSLIDSVREIIYKYLKVNKINIGNFKI